MRTLSLFSGIGGLDLGLERAGFRIVAQCEQDPFCRAVLAKHWPGVPIFEDVRTIDPAAVPGVECVCGGFPCQDVSVAGKGAGVEKGERSGLWREMHRVIADLRPRWVIAENVPALRTRGADLVLGDLERLGYACWPVVVGAEHVGAPHRRHRVFIVAYREGGGCGADGSPRRDAGHADECGEGVAHAERDGRGTGSGEPGHEGGTRERRGEPAGGGELADASSLGEVRLSAGPGRTHEAQADPHGPGEGVACGFCRHPFDLERLGRYGCPNCHGEGLGDPRRPGREELDAPALAARAGLGGGERDAGMGHADSRRGREQEPGRGPQGRTPPRWPSPPGHPQHPWEAPRLVELPLGGVLDGVPARLVRAANRHALRAYGNAVVPQVAEVVGRAVMTVDREINP